MPLPWCAGLSSWRLDLSVNQRVLGLRTSSGSDSGPSCLFTGVTTLNPIIHVLLLLIMQTGQCAPGWPSVLYLLKPCSINHLYSPLRIENFGCHFIKMINPDLPQWLTGKESRLPMQETWVWLLIREDPACHGATKPIGHNFWACALERGSCKCWATRCNYWSARPPEPVLHTKRHHCRAQALRLQRPPPTTATEKPARQRRPSTAKTKLIQSPPSGISYFRISTSLLFSGYPAL